jgi:hypothetical protein
VSLAEGRADLDFCTGTAAQVLRIHAQRIAQVQECGSLRALNGDIAQPHNDINAGDFIASGRSCSASFTPGDAPEPA